MKLLYAVVLFLFFLPANSLKGQEKTMKESNSLEDVFNISVEKNSSTLFSFAAEAVPSSDFIVISYTIKSPKNFFCEIIDKDGALVSQSEIRYDENLIDFSDVEPETYYLKIKDQSEELQTFKVVKKF